MLIGVDHGNKQIKTVHCAPFVSGLQQSMTRPFGPSLQYSGNYYTLSNERIPYRKDKTGDDRFFILTLIAIAEELTALTRKNCTVSSCRWGCRRPTSAPRRKSSLPISRRKGS